MPDSLSPREIILDCDPGHDDAMAIIFALGSPALHLRGITTVAGNQSVTKVTRNAEAVLRACGRDDIPVHAGATRPLLQAAAHAAAFHGDTGLDGVDLSGPLPSPASGHAVNFLIDTILQSPPRTITLVATAPLTNLALACRLEPNIVPRIREVVLMGGAADIGNSTAVAEFNVYSDPEAASIVFGEPWPLTMIGLDLTHQALFTETVQRRVAALDTDLSRFVLGILSFFRSAYRNVGFPDPPIHDACAVAYVADPALIHTIAAPISVECAGGITRGMTLVDRRRGANPATHARYATTLDFEGFWREMLAAIEVAGA